MKVEMKILIIFNNTYQYLYSLFFPILNPKPNSNFIIVLAL